MGTFRALLAFFATVSCGVLGLLSLVAQAGRFDSRADILTHFAPVYLALAVLGLFFGLAVAPASLRIYPVAAGLVAIVASAALVAPELLALSQTKTVPQGGRTFKIIQFNAWGRNPQGEAAARWLLAQNADAIVIEEGASVDHSLRAAGYHDSCASCAVTVYTKAQPVRVDPADRHHTPHPHLTSATLLDADSNEIVVVGIHRAWPTRFAFEAKDVADLRAYVTGLDHRRLIVAGDFNSTPWSFRRRQEDRTLGLIRRTRALFSWPAAQISHNRLPAPFPWLPIDHVYAGPDWATVSVTRGPKLGSDHYPVVVTLAPRDSGAR